MLHALFFASRGDDDVEDTPRAREEEEDDDDSSDDDDDDSSDDVESGGWSRKEDTSEQKGGASSRQRGAAIFNHRRRRRTRGFEGFREERGGKNIGILVVSGGVVQREIGKIGAMVSRTHRASGTVTERSTEKRGLRGRSSRFKDTTGNEPSRRSRLARKRR